MAGVRWALPRAIVVRRCPPALCTDCAMMEWPPRCYAPWMLHDCSIVGRPLVAPLRSPLRAMGVGCATMRAGRAMGARRCARQRIALGVALRGCRREFFLGGAAAGGRRTGEAPAMS
ncbi:hypothetical protein F511_46234 [Dorcoceras hygrometricum]|uniref:Uncharacterized protein n=1 Tax=Dorcoceras hygrometricum TaxID=472368 RepID=A0A2Z7A121_9LAMI|nr:hypothetical protein F511_46234 [Dorcoceras hygrometricum]